MTVNSILDLRDAYRSWQSQPVLVEYGPLRGYADHHTVQRMWRERIDPAVAAVDATCRKQPDGVHIAEAPSPWHAYFYLRAQHQYIYRLGRPLGETIDGDHPPAGEHVFFRGQRCANWDFKSSLCRRTPPEQAVERRAVTALVEYFRHTFSQDDNVATVAGRCFAQHYGIATELADITCEPDIAVWFATHPVNEPCEGSTHAAVRAVTWAGQLGHAETVFLLPPPFVRNVYLQRGLFLDTTSTGGAVSGPITLEVRFPRETAGGEFRVLRRGEPQEIWPAVDDAERDLVSWARSTAVECSDDDSVREYVQQRRDELPEFWLERQLYEPDRHLLEWLSILNWVLPATCVTALPAPPGGPGPMRYEVFGPKVKALAQANPGLFDVLRSSFKPRSGSYSDVIAHVLRLADQDTAMEKEL